MIPLPVHCSSILEGGYRQLALTMMMFDLSLSLNLREVQIYVRKFVCVGVMYSGEYDVCDVTLSVHPRWESNPRPLGYQSNALPTELRGQVGSS